MSSVWMRFGVQWCHVDLENNIVSPLSTGGRQGRGQISRSRLADDSLGLMNPPTGPESGQTGRSIIVIFASASMYLYPLCMCDCDYKCVLHGYQGGPVAALIWVHCTTNCACPDENYETVRLAPEHSFHAWGREDIGSRWFGSSILSTSLSPY